MRLYCPYLIFNSSLSIYLLSCEFLSRYAISLSHAAGDKSGLQRITIQKLQNVDSCSRFTNSYVSNFCIFCLFQVIFWFCYFLIKKTNKVALDFSFEHVDLRETTSIVNIEFWQLKTLYKSRFQVILGFSSFCYQQIEYSWFGLVIWMVQLRERFSDSEHCILGNYNRYKSGV